MTLILDQTADIPQAATAKSSGIEIPSSPVDANGVPTLFPGFNATLWALLQDIKAAGVPLTGKIAEYSGFYYRTNANGNVETRWDANTDNKNNSDHDQQPIATAAAQPNKSLDKLTFLIMFRLPFRKDSLNAHYGDPLAGPTTSWSYRANQLRTGTLRKLNQAGEQVNGSNRCDDSGVLLDDTSTGELNTPAAYLYYNNIGSNLPAVVATAVKVQPLYLYLAVITEGSFKLNPPPSDPTFSVVQHPEHISGLTDDKTPQPIPRRREVDLGMYKNVLGFEVFTPSTSIPSFPPYTIQNALIEKETSGAHAGEYYVAVPGPLPPPLPNERVYVRLKYPAEELSSNGTHSIGATVFEMDGLTIIQESTAGAEVYYASYYTRKNTWWPKFGFQGGGDIQFDNIATSTGMSGVTMGWGYDIGQGSRESYQYNIKFTIWARSNPQPAATTEFALRYKDRSTKIDFNASAKDVEAALLSLLGLKEKPWPDEKNKPAPRTVTVSKASSSGDPNYPTGWAITIVRANMDGPKKLFSDQAGEMGFFNIYSSNVFYQEGAQDSAMPNVKITPILEKDRHVVNSAQSAAKAWATFNTLLNDLFDVADWRVAAFPGTTPQDIQDRNNFEMLLRGCYAIRRGNFYLPVWNHYSLMSKFKLPSVEFLFPRWVAHFMKLKYYDLKAANLRSDVRNRTNAAEKYVLTTIAYGGDFFSNQDLNDAIRSKDLTKLLALVDKRNPTLPTRRDTIRTNLIDRFKKHLYRNIEED